MRFAFDIDNTIVQTINGNYAESTPIQERINLVNTLYNRGDTIILFTARGSASGKDYKKLTEDQMKLFGVKYHQLIFGKPDVDVFIDDKAISPLDWDKYFKSIL
jgi:dTDP-glucose 4,6-dehydratase